MAEASYPDDLLLPRPARLGAAARATTHAVFGITWYAQDSLGEVVFYDPPEVGATLTKDPPTPRSSRSRPSPT